ncbi:MAG: hypothetical protein N2317_06345 [Syntrophales bacterium]|nr:hypothetical protein [Syntrophales bacterium]
MGKGNKTLFDRFVIPSGTAQWGRVATAYGYFPGDGNVAVFANSTLLCLGLLDKPDRFRGRKKVLRGVVMWKKVIILFCFVLLVGCATIMGKGVPELLILSSNPSRASVLIKDEQGRTVFEGLTPTSVSLPKKKGYFRGKTYTVTISKEGFADCVIKVDTTPSGWYIAGNLVFGGLIGWLIVDPLTGAMWTLDTEAINADLTESKKTSQLGIALLQDVPEGYRGRLVPLRR